MAAEDTGARITTRRLAAGIGWFAEEIICTAGAQDRPFEEQHTYASVAFVVSGTFQYRAASGRVLMTPGSLLLGNAGESFECAHDHGPGDRCISFKFASDMFEKFRVSRLPAVAALSLLAARVSAAVTIGAAAPWEELAVEVAGSAIELGNGRPSKPSAAPAGAEARVSRVVRAIEYGLPDEAPLTPQRLADDAGLSPYHFLRTFRQLTGVTPHQYVRRARLRQAAARLIENRSAVLDVALDCGFGDLSNFNRAFRAEFGMSPRQLRRASLPQA